MIMPFCTRCSLNRPSISGLSFAIKPGELLHVLGRNGTGKTTLLRTICGLTRPAQGEIRWRQQDIKKLGDDYRTDIAYLGHNDGIQGELTPKENLDFAVSLAATTNSGSINQMLETIGLAGLNHLPAKVLSQGQKRRLALARLLILKKPLWLLDEPFSALDTTSTSLMEGLLREHLAQNGMIIITTHHELKLSNTSIQRLSLDEHR